MGNRRFSRKRLFEVEKRGQPVDLESGAGIAPAIGATTQHRNGAELITEIVVDLGSTRGNIVGGGTQDLTVGVASKKAMITRLTEAKYGRLVEVRIVCLEDAGQDFDLVVGSDSVNTAASPTGRAELAAGIGNDKGEDISADDSVITAIDSNGVQTEGNEWYLYLTNANGNGSGAAINAGKFLIYLHGFVAPDDLV